MKNKIIGFFVCILLVITAIPVVGITNEIIKNKQNKSILNDPKPDLECDGAIIRHRVKPGHTFDGLFGAGDFRLALDQG